MPETDRVSEQDAGLIAAAQTAASWAHARRATWTSVPLPAVASAPALVAEVPVAEAPGVDDRFEVLEPEPEPMLPSVPAAPRREWNPAVLRWAVRGGVAAALVAAAAIGGPYVFHFVSASLARTAAVAPSTPAPAGTATGGLRVTSTPPGARVLVDGKARGATPLTLGDLSPGRHEVTLTSAEGTVHRTVTVAASEVAAIDEAIFAGWVTVYAPFDLTIAEGGRVLRADDRNQIMLPPGPHDLRLTNRALGYEITRRVEVKPGEATNLQLAMPSSTLTVSAPDGAEVWVDGTRLGETPLNAASIPLGTHDVVVRRAGGGERRYSITIGAKPYTLKAEF